MTERFTVYITLYALSSGIFEAEVEMTTSEKTVYHPSDRIGCSRCYHKPHWHETREEAIERAEQMRLKKIASLEKQLKKIKKLNFM